MVNLLLNSGGALLNGKPITYLTQWKIVGNSEVHGQEIWSCGEYNSTDGKYHILAQPLGGSIADIALTEPLRKVNDVADTIEFADGTATLIRNIGNKKFSDLQFVNQTAPSGKLRFQATVSNKLEGLNIGLLCAKYTTASWTNVASKLDADDMIIGTTARVIAVHDEAYTDAETFKTDNANIEVFYPLAKSITETIEVPQIAEADSYTCVITPSAHAVNWSNFITDKEQLYAYGVQWDKEVANQDVTRIGNMELHKADKLPVQNAMRGCLLDDNGDVVQYLSDSDWQNTSLLDGSHGQVMIEIPTFYWKFSEDENGIQKVMLSMVEIEGYKKVNKMYVSAYEATIDRGNAEGTGATSTWKLASVKNNSPRFRGGNNDSSKDSAYNTLLQMPATNISLTECRTYARRRKANSSEWNLYTFQIHKILYWLFVVEYATRNSQKAINNTLTTEGYHQGGLGDGPTSANDSNWYSLFSYYPFIPIGTSDSLGNNTGQVTYASLNDSGTVWCITQSNRYRGIENPFGHIWKWVDGIHVQVESGENGESKVYVTDNPSLWQDSNNNNYNYVGNETRVNSYVKDILFDDGNIMCSDSQTSSTQYYCDYHYVNIPSSGSSLRAVRFGGAANCSSIAGFVFSSTNNAPSSQYAIIGSRLCFIPNI